MTPKNVAIGDRNLLEQARKLASDAGLTVDDLATEGLRREVGRRTLEKLKPEALARRGSMSDAQVDAVVEKAVHESRGR